MYDPSLYYKKNMDISYMQSGRTKSCPVKNMHIIHWQTNQSNMTELGDISKMETLEWDKYFPISIQMCQINKLY